MRTDRPTLSPTSRPKLARRARLTFDPSRERHVLLGPESVVVLNRTGADILELCDGQRTVADIVAVLSERFDRVRGDEVSRFLARLVDKRYLEVTDG